MTNEINTIFMTLIESTLNKMIDARVEAKVGELNQRITALEEKMGSLENCQDNDQSENNRRLVALEGRFSLSILDSEEFRHAVQQAQGASVTIDLDSQEFVYAVKRIADNAAEEAMSEHCSDYDHDDIEAANETDEDAVTDIIKEYLRNVTVRLDV